MTKFDIHTPRSAPQASIKMLEESGSEFGMIPNLHGVMAEAPTVLEAYKKLHELALLTSFTDDEKTVIWQTINVEHNCHYCIPAHSGIAKAMGVDESIDNAVRNSEPLPQTKLNKLRDFVLALVRNRGRVNSETSLFFDAGFSKQQALEVVLFLSQKIMSNYINHFTSTPVDDAFKAFE